MSNDGREDRRWWGEIDTTNKQQPPESKIYLLVFIFYLKRFENFLFFIEILLFLFFNAPEITKLYRQDAAYMGMP